MRLLLFEWKKLFFTKRFFYTMLLLALLIVGLFARNWFFQDIVVDEEEIRIVLLTREVQESLRVVSKEVETNPENENASDRLSDLSAAQGAIYDLRPLISSDDWIQRLEKENQFLEAIQSYKIRGGKFSITTTELERKLALNNELINRGVSPEDDTFSIALPNFFLQITQVYVNAGAIVVFIILTGDLLTNEFEQRSIQFLITQPLKKTSILHAKAISMVMFYVILTLSVLGFSWLLGFTFGAPGSWSYPIQNLNDPQQFQSITTYVIQATLATTLTIFAVISVVLLSSILIKQTIGTFFATLLILLGGYFIFSQFAGGANPFETVFSGRTLQMNGNIHWVSIATMVFIAVGAYVMALGQIKRAF